MKYEVTLGGRTATVDVRENPGGGWKVSIDGADPVVVTGEHGGPLGPTGWLLDGPAGRRALDVHLDGDRAFVLDRGIPLRGEVVDPRERALEAALGGGEGAVATQMPGAIVRVLVEAGQAVEEGDVLVVVEAMKMENEFKAPFDGTVTEVSVAAGQAVEAGTVLCVLEPSA